MVKHPPSGTSASDEKRGKAATWNLKGGGGLCGGLNRRTGHYGGAGKGCTQRQWPHGAVERKGRDRATRCRRRKRRGRASWRWPLRLRDKAACNGGGKQKGATAVHRSGTDSQISRNASSLSPTWHPTREGHHNNHCFRQLLYLPFWPLSPLHRRHLAGVPVVAAVEVANDLWKPSWKMS